MSANINNLDDKIMAFTADAVTLREYAEIARNDNAGYGIQSGYRDLCIKLAHYLLEKGKEIFPEKFPLLKDRLLDRSFTDITKGHFYSFYPNDFPKLFKILKELENSQGIAKVVDNCLNEIEKGDHTLMGFYNHDILCKDILNLLMQQMSLSETEKRSYIVLSEFTDNLNSIFKIEIKEQMIKSYIKKIGITGCELEKSLILNHLNSIVQINEGADGEKITEERKKGVLFSEIYKIFEQITPYEGHYSIQEFDEFEMDEKIKPLVELMLKFEGYSINDLFPILAYHSENLSRYCIYKGVSPDNLDGENKKNWNELTRYYRSLAERTEKAIQIRDKAQATLLENFNKLATKNLKIQMPKEIAAIVMGYSDGEINSNDLFDTSVTVDTQQRLSKKIAKISQAIQEGGKRSTIDKVKKELTEVMIPVLSKEVVGYFGEDIAVEDHYAACLVLEQETNKR